MAKISPGSILSVQSDPLILVLYNFIEIVYVPEYLGTYYAKYSPGMFVETPSVVNSWESPTPIGNPSAGPKNSIKY